jgi:hypothetical protein
MGTVQKSQTTSDIKERIGREFENAEEEGLIRGG